MNIYVRYFSQEILVSTIDKVFEFLDSIPEIAMDDNMRGDVVDFVASSNPYPKRIKVRPRAYFILIKTDAQTMEEFKERNYPEPTDNEDVREDAKELIQRNLYEELPGWYQVTLIFKRVINIPGTGKFGYEDTEIVAQVKAHCIQECYDKVVDYIQSREDVDERSQFPSIKGKNFFCEYLGMEPDSDEELVLTPQE